MTKTLKILVVALAATTALALTAGPAGAHGGKRFGAHSLMRAAMTYLGVSKQELREARTARQSLAQLAVANGKSVEGLKAAMITAGTARIDAAVAARRLTTERAAKLKTRLPARVDRIVNRTPGVRANARARAASRG